MMGKMDKLDQPEEGGHCPDHECPHGRLHYPKVKNCQCHTNPPCSYCVDNPLTCDKCGWEEEKA